MFAEGISGCLFYASWYDCFPVISEGGVVSFRSVSYVSRFSRIAWFIFTFDKYQKVVWFVPEVYFMFPDFAELHDLFSHLISNLMLKWIRFWIFNILYNLFCISIAFMALPPLTMKHGIWVCNQVRRALQASWGFASSSKNVILWDRFIIFKIKEMNMI